MAEEIVSYREMKNRRGKEMHVHRCTLKRRNETAWFRVR
jgi:hypothetical protein